MKTEQEMKKALETYANMVQRICLYYLKNHADTEDVFQNVFLKYILHSEPFVTKAHEKAWLIRVTISYSKISQISFSTPHRAFRYTARIFLTTKQRSNISYGNTSFFAL